MPASLPAKLSAVQHPISGSAPAPRELDLHEALRSSIRAWLVSRDEVLWVICGGTDSANRLESLDLVPAQAAMEQMHVLLGVIQRFASQIIDKNQVINDVISAELDVVLAETPPKFSLKTDIPGSF